MAGGVAAKASPLVERIWQLSREADAARGAPPDFAPGEADSITIERMVSKKRGSWFKVPHEPEPTDRTKTNAGAPMNKFEFKLNGKRLDPSNTGDVIKQRTLVS